MSREGEGRPDRGIVMRSLRTRFVLVAVVLVIAAAGFQYAGIQMSINQTIDPSNGNPTLTNSYALLTILSTLSTVCVAVAVALVGGVVATLVIEATLDRMAERDGSDASDESAALAAYGSDPELL